MLRAKAALPGRPSRAGKQKVLEIETIKKRKLIVNYLKDYTNVLFAMQAVLL